jgi:hypothetical protein
LKVWKNNLQLSKNILQLSNFILKVLEFISPAKKKEKGSGEMFGKTPINFVFPNLSVTLASPKLLSFDKAKCKKVFFHFALCSLIRNVGFAQVTLVRQSKMQKSVFSFCFVLTYP